MGAQMAWTLASQRPETCLQQSKCFAEKRFGPSGLRSISFWRGPFYQRKVVAGTEKEEEERCLLHDMIGID
ncbi:unnamed protein product [Dovyalis caffra]|uniref:Uncharacterized protein n=1 Tax=Dovyalis caffra TaxID=77055 RepID=A0AAV1RT29_9ROSI|nr:unnamed protein product [Dovyalis caffra]